MPPLPSLAAPPLGHLAVTAAATAAALLAGVGAVSVVRAADGLSHAPPAPRAFRVPKAADGHFWAQARMNGRPVRVLIDTGSSAVALTLADARALGVDTDHLAFTRSIATASGPTQAAPVTLAKVSVAGAEVPRVHALVVRAGLDASLLGMSYLGRLNGFSADRTGLTLTP